MPRITLGILGLLLAIWTQSAFPQSAVQVDAGSFAFSVLPPAGWTRQAPASPNSRVKFVSPPNTLPAECAVIVQDYPALRGVTQALLNQQMASPITPGEIAAGLSATYNNVRIISSTKTALIGYPANQFRVEMSVGNRGSDTWMNSLYVQTATTPGLIWTVSCGGTGKTAGAAQQAFSYWQLDIAKFPMGIKILRN